MMLKVSPSPSQAKDHGAAPKILSNSVKNLRKKEKFKKKLVIL